MAAGEERSMKRSVWAVGLLALVGLLIAPARVTSAAAILTVAPAAGPPGTKFEVTGAGFAPGTDVVITVEQPVFGRGRFPNPAGTPVESDTIRADAGGRIRYTLATSPTTVPFLVDAVVPSPGGEELARARFAVTSPGG